MDSPGLCKASFDFNNLFEFSGLLQRLGCYNKVVYIRLDNIFALYNYQIRIRYGV